MAMVVCRRGHIGDRSPDGHCRACRALLARQKYHEPSDAYRSKMLALKAHAYADPIKRAAIRACSARSCGGKSSWRRNLARKEITKEAATYKKLIAADPCAYCGGTSSATDHIDPISRSGSGEWDNFAAACGRCNNSKHAHPLALWLAIEAQRRFHHQRRELCQQ